jgi:TP901 family phage tail tape measure protein
MTNRNFVYNIILNIKENAGRQIDSISNKFSNLSEKAKLATAALTASFIALSRNLLGVAGNFEKVFKSIEASIRPSVKELEDLRKKAKQIGLTTQFSATQAAEAIEILGKIGVKTSDIIGGVLDNTLSLATAMGVGLEPAAKLLTDTMTLFNVKVEDAAKTTDLLVGATNNSKFGLEDMSLALAQSGAVAASSGVGLREYLVTLTSISSAFASGSDAGTSLKTMLNSLSNPSKEAKAKMKELGIEVYDANGSLKSMVGISTELQEGLAGLTEEQKANAVAVIFGSDASRAAIALAGKTREELIALDKAIGDTKTAEIAKKQSEGYLAATKILDNAFEGLKIAIADSGVLAFFTKFITIIGKGVKAIAELPKPVLLVGAAISTLAVGAVALVTGLGFLSTTVLPALVAGFGLVTAPILGVVAAVAVAGALIVNYWDEISDYFTNGTGSKTFNKIIELATVFYDIIVNLFNKLVSAVSAVWSRFGDEITTGLKNTLEVLLGIVNSILSVFISLFSTVSNILQGNFREAFTDFVMIFTNAFNTIVKIVGNAVVLIANELAFFAKLLPGIGDDVANWYESVSQYIKDFMSEFDKSIDRFGNKKIKPPSFSGGSGDKSDDAAQKKAALDKEKADTEQMNKFRQASKEIALGISQDRIEAKLKELDDLKSLDETRLEDLKKRQEEELKLTEELYKKQIAVANLAADEQLANNLGVNVNELTKEDRIKSLQQITEKSKQLSTEEGKFAREQLLIINKAYADSASLRLEREDAIRDIKIKYDKEEKERITALNKTNDNIIINTIDNRIEQLKVEKQQTSNLEDQIKITQNINKLESEKLAIKIKQQSIDALKSAGVDVSDLEKDNKVINDQIALLQKYKDIVASFAKVPPIAESIDKYTKQLEQSMMDLGSMMPDVQSKQVMKILKETSKKTNLSPESIVQAVKDSGFKQFDLDNYILPSINSVFEKLFKERGDIVRANQAKLKQLSEEDAKIIQSFFTNIDTSKTVAPLEAIDNKIKELQTSLTTLSEGGSADKAVEKLKEVIATGSVEEASKATEALAALVKPIRDEVIRASEDILKVQSDNLNESNQLLEEKLNEQQIIIDTSEQRQRERQKAATSRSFSELIDNIKDLNFDGAFKNIFALTDGLFTRKRRQIAEIIAALNEQKQLELQIAEDTAKKDIISNVTISSDITDPKEIEAETKRQVEAATKRFDTLLELTKEYGGNETKIREEAAKLGINNITNTELTTLLKLANQRSQIITNYTNKENEINKTALQTRLDNTAEFFQKVTEVGRGVASVIGGIFQILNAEAQLQLEILQQTIAELGEKLSEIQGLISESEAKVSELETIFAESTGKRRTDAIKLYDAEIDKLLKLKAAEASLTAEKKRAEDEAARIDREQRQRAEQLAVINQLVATTSMIAAAAKGLSSSNSLPFPANLAAMASTVAALLSLFATAKTAFKFEDGGLVSGKRHSQGGVPFTVAGQGGYEMEGGEYIMSRKAVERIGVNTLDSMNFGSKSIIPKTKFETGGLVEQQINNSTDDRFNTILNLTAQLANRPVYVAVTDVNTANSKENNRVVSSTF